jgi:hypothetical protein
VIPQHFSMPGTPSLGAFNSAHETVRPLLAVLRYVDQCFHLTMSKAGDERTAHEEKSFQGATLSVDSGDVRWRGRWQRARANGRGLVYGPDNPVPASLLDWAHSEGHDLKELFPEGVPVLVSHHRVSSYSPFLRLSRPGN